MLQIPFHHIELLSCPFARKSLDGNAMSCQCKKMQCLSVPSNQRMIRITAELMSFGMGSFAELMSVGMGSFSKLVPVNMGLGLAYAFWHGLGQYDPICARF